jgi:2-dehydro-3-deoxyphosphogluconate aldolase/(4S)-4-hydroxy-2-oxoglutarate aldolase
VLVAVVRGNTESSARLVSEAILEAGIRALEITATTPGAFTALAALEKQRAEAVLGIGTIRRPEDIVRAKDAGARFLVSPHTDRLLIQTTREHDLVSIPGALTPSEIIEAHAVGADFVKIFPVSAVGGARYLRLLRAPVYGIPFWVSGSVAIEEIEDMVEANAALIGLTSALIADLPESGDEAKRIVRARTEKAIAALHRAKAGRPLLTIAGRTFRFTDLANVGSEDRASLESLLPERRGQAVRLRRFLVLSGIPEAANVEVKSADGGFVRQVSAKSLYEGGWLHYATDGEPLARGSGGPVRLYILSGDNNCDNVKGLAEISLVS